MSDRIETRAYSANGRSTGELVKEITEDLSTLVRKEVELAKQEIGSSMVEKAKGAVVIGVAAVAALYAFAFIALALRDGIATWLPEWAGDLITAFALLAMGAGAAFYAKSKLTAPVRADLTKQTIKEDVQWAKTLGKR